MAFEITPGVDAYLDYHKHSAQSYERAAAVMQKWEHMVGLATSRALEELSTPTECVVIPFPVRPNPPADGCA